MDIAIERSNAYFDSGYGCAEAVLMAVTESKGMKSELIPRIATGFCGGMAHTNNMCGAVTGAVMALNLIYGRDHAGESKEKNYQAIQTFLNKFREKFGDTLPVFVPEATVLGVEPIYADYTFHGYRAPISLFESPYSISDRFRSCQVHHRFQR